MDLGIHLNVQGTFQIEKFKADGTVTYKGEVFNNTVLKSGLVKLNTISGADMILFINLGSDNTPPNSDQTGLIDRRFSTNTKFSAMWYYSDAYLCCGVCGCTFQFNIGTCTGTHSELGLSNLSNANYFNRQLIKDAQGNPMDLIVAADEGLRISVSSRISLNPAFLKSYHDVYSFDLKGATAGGVTFTNGVINYALIFSDFTPLKMRYYLNRSLFVLNSAIVIAEYRSGKIYLYANPLNTAPLNLSIVSHTLTGGTGAPELILEQPFGNGMVSHTFELTDEILGTSSTIAANVRCINNGYQDPPPMPSFRDNMTYTSQPLTWPNDSTNNKSIFHYFPLKYKVTLVTSTGAVLGQVQKLLPFHQLLMIFQRQENFIGDLDNLAQDQQLLLLVFI